VLVRVWVVVGGRGERRVVRWRRREEKGDLGVVVEGPGTGVDDEGVGVEEEGEGMGAE